MRLGKKLLALSICFIMLFGTVAIGGDGIVSLIDKASIKADAMEYEVGDIIEFGSYPQTDVTSSMGSTLNSKASGWKSYNYYSGTADNFDDTSNGQMTASDYMRYCDVEYGGNKYRGVVFDSYRPQSTGLISRINYTWQHHNGYTTGTIYWFKYEPLRWRILDASTGLVMCETIIDSQPYSNYIEYNSGDGECYNDKGNYTSDWETSSLKTWLNNDFYSTAFTSTQQSKIKTTTLNNDGCYTLTGTTGYEDLDSATTNDKIFLLSYDEVLNSSYGFSTDYQDDTARQADGSDYAKCQGLGVYTNGCSAWWLRSPGCSSNGSCCVDHDGYVTGYCYCYTNDSDRGVRPAMCLSELKSDTSSQVDYETGDIISFGSYPQSDVTDSLGSILNSRSGTWQSYGYYTGTGEWDDGQMTASNYMRYKDVTYKGEKYRGVVFDKYRPSRTGYVSSADNSFQDDNGYEPGKTYWFIYEPLKWRILDPMSGFVMCDSVIDSQAFSNYVVFVGEYDEYGSGYGDFYNNNNRFANEWATSSIREWLNNDFYLTAFNLNQQSNIQTSTVLNKDGAYTNDKVFMLSWDEVRNQSYGFDSYEYSIDTAKSVGVSQYALCQGYGGESYKGWWLRTGYSGSAIMRGITSYGYPSFSIDACETNTGIVPALKLKELKVYVAGHETEEPTLTDNLNIMSYNVYTVDDTVKNKDTGTTYDCHYDKRAKYIVNNIMDEEPDSVGFQELTKEMKKKLEKQVDLQGRTMGDIYEFVGKYREGSGNNEGTLIAYRTDKYDKKDEGTWWLSEDGRKHPYAKTDYNRTYTWILLENKETKQQYLHINAHLDHDDKAADFSADEIIDFVDSSYPDVPVVLTGDFNHKKDATVYTKLKKAGFVDTNVRQDTTDTYNNWINVKNGGDPKTIDYILVKNGLEKGVKDYSVVTNDYSDAGLNYPYPSDHHPVVAELSLFYTDTVFEGNTIYSTESEHVSTNTIRYDSDWFSYNNKHYNHDLARFCSDFAMMGYTNKEYELRNNLAQFGFGNAEIDLNTGKDEDPGRDRVNYFIADKKEIINGEEYTVIFAGFIGSDGYQWFSNFDPYGTERKNSYAGDSEKDIVHLGFADARDFALKKLQAHINALGTDSSKIKLVITGHSRGAAAANLISAKIADNYIVPINNIYTYTFATPNTINFLKVSGMVDGNDNWNSIFEIMKNGNAFTEKYAFIFNIVNPEDFVTKVLLAKWGYGRYGETITLPSKTNDIFYFCSTALTDVYYDNESLYKGFLADMQDKFKDYTGEKYDPYKKGEQHTYQIINSMGNIIQTLADLYSSKFIYHMSLLEGVDLESPFTFIKNTLLKYLVHKDMSEIKRIVVTCDVFYKEILAYFAWPDIDSQKAVKAIQDGTNIMDSVTLGGKFAQAHQMETYCAYMNSMGSGWLRRQRKAYKNTVNCPVDIEVYDNETNELVGKITNNVIDETVSAKENSVVMTVDGDSKEFWLPSNGDYRVVLTGNDNGTMDYTVSQIDSDLGETERVNFFDVDIEKGVSMIGEFSDGLLNVEDYTLTLADNTELKPDEIIEGESNIFNINVTAEGSGCASSSQTAISGDYVSLSAEAQEGAGFLGWYENGKQISNEAEYSFVAKSNRDLVAKFENKKTPEGPVKPEEPTNPEEPSVPAEPVKPDFSGFKIKNFSSTFSVDYKSTVIFHTTMEAPEGYEIVWSNNVKGSECKLNSVTDKEYKVSAKMVNKTTGEAEAVTEEVTVKVNTGFFAKLIAFFKGLFGSLPTYEDFKKK